MRLLMTLTTLLLLGGCNGQSPFGNQWNQPNLGTAEAPAGEPSLEGSLVEASTGVGGGTLIVQAASGDATTLRLNARTIMMRQDGRRVSFTAFEPGQRLRVWLGEEAAETVMILE